MRRFNLIGVMFSCLWYGLAPGAAADGPQDTVRWIYTSLGNPGPAQAKGLAFLTAPQQRTQYLSRRMVAFLNANDSYGNDLAAACIDFALDIPGQDFDTAEIARTLAVQAQGDTTRQVVTATFLVFNEPAQIQYDFVAEDGFWRIDDIAGPGWRVSQIPCHPKAVQSDAPAGYCYKIDDSVLRLSILPDGGARFSMVSWQANAHSCSAQGTARPISGGWAYEDVLNGAPCRIEILVMSDSGLRLTDRDWACKPALCGQRAVLDGLVFGPTSQVNCADVPADLN